MTFTFQWMSITKARVSQISSEYFNGSGSRDLQQDRSEIVRDGREGRMAGGGGGAVVVRGPKIGGCT